MSPVRKGVAIDRHLSYMSVYTHPSRLSHMYLYLRVKNCIDRPRGGPSYIYKRPIITRNEIFIFNIF